MFKEVARPLHLAEPGEPLALPDLSRLCCTGIYFLMHQGEVVYVGQARIIRRRIGSHISEGVKRFDSVAFVRCDPNSLNRLEQAYIKRYLPKYNQCSMSNHLRRMKRLGQDEATLISRAAAAGDLRTIQIKKRIPRSSKCRTVTVIAE